MTVPFTMEKLPFKEKMMMTMVKKMMMEGDDLKEYERMLLDTLNEPVDHVSRENVQKVIKEIREKR